MPIPPGAHVSCTTVVIDDRCDACGDAGKGRRGVIFEPGRGGPVICSACLRPAFLLLLVHSDRPVGSDA